MEEAEVRGSWRNGERAGPAVEARGLVKRYGELTAVAGVDFRVERGECFGFLGPNGAGKSTTIRMITCRVPPSRGELRVLGLDVRGPLRPIKARMGVVSQEDNLDQGLTSLENLVLHGLYYGLRRAEAERRAWRLLDFMSLGEKAAVRPQHLSGGQRRRLAIARALVNEPELLVLDEPTTGLDPQARVLVWERLAELRDRGVTIVLTTHYMEEARRLSDRLVLMDHGRIIARGRPEALVRRELGGEVVELDEPLAGGDGLGGRLGGFARRHPQLVRRLERTRSGWQLFTPAGEELLRALTEEGLRTRHYRLREADLEDLFLAMTGRELEEE
ncbi:MAG: ABC transporter ATP-binding protein [Clostridia bacterium]|nr:ABC transporter ATP-binding protein [Clostridia bacterium]MCL6521385.1 ABC transporter ATP-binding protein [Bacillota bacterium]